jgi:acyl dehydratase
MAAVLAAAAGLQVGETVVHFFRITDAEMQAFGQLSGDWNPVHADASFAAAKGYRAPIVYGGLLIAKISGLLGMSLPGRNGVWCSVRLEFSGPLYVGEDVRLRGAVVQFSSSTELGVIQLEISTGERIVARGKAEVRVAVA